MNYSELLENVDDDSQDLDCSWINQDEKLDKINQNYFREPMELIDIFFLYINSNSYIEKIICEKHPLILMDDNKTNVLKKEYILQLIQSKKIKTDHSLYKLIDILTYNIDLEPNHIQPYSQQNDSSDISKGFFNVLKIVDDIKIPPSIFIFHGINSIFFIFQEKEFDISQLKPKSILKGDSFDVNSTGSQHKSTKKVKIMIGVNKPDKLQSKQRFTRKHV